MADILTRADFKRLDDSFAWPIDAEDLVEAIRAHFREPTKWPTIEGWDVT